MTWTASSRRSGSRTVTKTRTMDFITPQQLAEQTGWSLRRLKMKAREIGACRILGNRIVLTPEDVEAILEACRPVVAPPMRPWLTGTHDDLVRLGAAAEGRRSEGN